MHLKEQAIINLSQKANALKREKLSVHAVACDQNSLLIFLLFWLALLELETHVFSEMQEEILAVVLKKTGVGCNHVEDQGADLPVALIPKVALLEMVNQVLLALDASIGDLAYLLRVEALPGLSVELFKELKYVDRFDKIDEGVPNIALVFEIDR